MVLQAAQVKYQQCLSSELIENILQLNINYLYEITLKDADTRTFEVMIQIQTKDNQTITVSKKCDGSIIWLYKILIPLWQVLLMIYS